MDSPARRRVAHRRPAGRSPRAPARRGPARTGPAAASSLGERPAEVARACRTRSTTWRPGRCRSPVDAGRERARQRAERGHECVPSLREDAEAAGRGMPAALGEVRGAGLQRRRRRGSRPGPGPIRAPRRPTSAAAATGRASDVGQPAGDEPEQARRPGVVADDERRHRRAPQRPGRAPPRWPRAVISRRRSWTASSSSARSSARVGSSSSSSAIASSASAMRPAALMRGTTPNAEVAGRRLLRVARDDRAQQGAQARHAWCRPARPGPAARWRGSPRSSAPGRRSCRSRPPRRGHRSSPVAGEQRGGELVREAGAGQVGIGIGAVGAMRDRPPRPRAAASPDGRWWSVIDDVQPEARAPPRPRPRSSRRSRR